MIVYVNRDSIDSSRLVLRLPYDPALLDAVRSVPGRTFDEKRKVWSIPDTPENVLTLWRALPKGAELVLPPSLQRDLRARQDGIERAKAIREAGDHETDFAFVTQPYAHQRAGLGFLQSLGSGALLWEMGLGKTKTAIDYCESIGATKVLVICPNTVTGNWVAEVKKHTNKDRARVLTGSLKDKASQFRDAVYSIVNVEALSFPVFATAAAAFPWDVVIVDESTRFKSPKSKRTKALHKIKPPHRIIMTGTPITNSPEDAWAQFEWIQPGLFGTYWKFADQFLVKDFFHNVIGIKPDMRNELQARIGRRSYRILKADVLDLPPKVYSDRVVELTGAQQQAYRQMKEDLIVQIAAAPSVTASTILVQLLRLTQITAGLVGHGDDYLWLPDNAKVTELDHLLNEELAGEQVVVFGLYQRELEELAARYTPGALRRVKFIDIELPEGRAHIDGDFGMQIDPTVQLPIIYGPTPPAMRTQLINEFQQGRRRLLFIQSRTGGIGINLTAAKTAIYYTRGWSLEDYLQSQDRLHRIGQTGTVSILHLVAKATVDEDIAKALNAKQDLADTLTGDAARRFAASVLGEQ